MKIPLKRLILETAAELTSDKNAYGLRWTQFTSNGGIETKERFFDTERARIEFVSELEHKANFNQVVSYLDEATGTADVASYDAPLFFDDEEEDEEKE